MLLVGQLDSEAWTFLNYGAFALIAFLVFMFVWKIYPGMQAEHRKEREAANLGFQAAVTKLVDAFEKDSDQNREERMAAAREAAAERDKDRALRIELTKAVHELSAAAKREGR